MISLFFIFIVLGHDLITNTTLCNLINQLNNLSFNNYYKSQC